MRAHLNCLENLPIYGAIVLVIVVSGAQRSALDSLALTLIGARIVQTLIQVSWKQTNLLAYLRFGFFFVQLICMFWMAARASATTSIAENQTVERPCHHVRETRNGQ